MEMGPLMSSNAFTVAGEALFGERWPSAIGHALNLNERTVRRWMLDAGSIPESLWQEILEVIGERHLALVAAQEAIEAHLEKMRSQATET
jgi:hypothetical protein